MLLGSNLFAFVGKKIETLLQLADKGGEFVFGEGEHGRVLLDGGF
jgi:nucleoside permease NupC